MTTRLASTLAAALLGAAAIVLTPAAGAATVDVRIERSGFVPASLTVAAGDTVRWTNRDTLARQVVSETGSFVSPILRPGQSYSYTFESAGTYRYRDGTRPAERATVVVSAPPPAVTLAATTPIVVYGGQTHLAGTVSSRAAGEQVSILQAVQGGTGYAPLATVTTGAGGAFDVAVSPAILTAFTAQYRGATSGEVRVQVRPKLTLNPSRRGWFLTRVAGARSFAGRWVYLQRRSGFGQWVSIARFRLGARSGKLFRVPNPRSVQRYRVFMTINQAGAGYLEGWSGTQTVRPR